MRHESSRIGQVMISNYLKIDNTKLDDVVLSINIIVNLYDKVMKFEFGKYGSHSVSIYVICYPYRTLSRDMLSLPM